MQGALSLRSTDVFDLKKAVARYDANDELVAAKEAERLAREAELLEIAERLAKRGDPTERYRQIGEMKRKLTSARVNNANVFNIFDFPSFPRPELRNGPLQTNFKFRKAAQHQAGEGVLQTAHIRAPCIGA